METNSLKSKAGKRGLLMILLFLGLRAIPQNAFAHCDSYDGPVVKDALKALENNDPGLVMKWIDVEHENVITDLFHKTLKYKSGDKEVYGLLETHFLETLVRLHREGEGEPFTGLKPAGTTKQIIKLTDTALKDQDFEGFLRKFNGHVNEILTEKYAKVAQLDKVKNESVQKGREFVAAYVDYTHTIEMMHDILEHTGGAHQAH
ncbi:MAG TPA: DUF6448 family protein [Gillisia sp.]|nr:DUF6448 family protein [Gillisia sp.]